MKGNFNMTYEVIRGFMGLDTSVQKGDILTVEDYTDDVGIYPALWKGNLVVCDIGSKSEQNNCKIIA
jgi:hypothetical protein